MGIYKEVVQALTKTAAGMGPTQTTPSMPGGAHMDDAARDQRAQQAASQNQVAQILGSAPPAAKAPPLTPRQRAAQTKMQTQPRTQATQTKAPTSAAAPAQARPAAVPPKPTPAQRPLQPPRPAPAARPAPPAGGMINGVPIAQIRAMRQQAQATTGDRRLQWQGKTPAIPQTMQAQVPQAPRM